MPYPVPASIEKLKSPLPQVCVVIVSVEELYRLIFAKLLFSLQIPWALVAVVWYGAEIQYRFAVPPAKVKLTLAVSSWEPTIIPVVVEETVRPYDTPFVMEKLNKPLPQV